MGIKPVLSFYRTTLAPVCVMGEAWNEQELEGHQRCEQSLKLLQWWSEM